MKKHVQSNFHWNFPPTPEYHNEQHTLMLKSLHSKKPPHLQQMQYFFPKAKRIQKNIQVYSQSLPYGFSNFK